MRWTRAHYRLPDDEFLIRETVQNVYRTCKGFADKSSLLPEQLFVMQMDEFMKRRYEFRFNLLTSQVECRQRNSFDFYFRPVNKRLMASITMNAQYEGLKLWDKDVVRYLNSDHVPVYQPIEEFLYDLPRWDGKDHIGDLAKRVPCNNPHWAQLFRRWFLSMIAHWRGLGKNHANSTSPILVGPQAYRKSTFCRLILPPCLQAYYTDSIDFSRKRDAELYLNRFLLINMDEFDQIGINQQPFLKHIMQKPVVNTRRPNASAVEELRRYASFIGTSNHKDLLTDTSGSRRYIGVEVTGVIDVVRPVDYEQLYAQAMAALYHNERYWFDERDEAIMTEANQEFEQSPAIEQLFQVYYRAAGKRRMVTCCGYIATYTESRQNEILLRTSHPFRAYPATVGSRVVQENTWGLLSCSGFGVILLLNICIFVLRTKRFCDKFVLRVKHLFPIFVLCIKQMAYGSTDKQI